MNLGNHLLKAAMLSSISIASLSVGSVAFAQDNTPQASDEADENVIIVTATKREQTLQEVPVAVSVTSAEAIERSQVRDLRDLQTLVPTLRVGQFQESAQVSFIIRGYSSGANNSGIESSIGVFIDGVYRSRSAAAISDLPNLQRVEVLRGPQSTLYGKNSSAGVISIVTAAPSYEYGGSAEISYGNRNAIVARADITGPISDNIAFSLAGGINKADGYGTNLTDGSKTSDRNRWYSRAQLLIEPTENVRLRIIGDYDKIDESCCFVGNVFGGPTVAAIRAVGGNINAGGGLSYSEYQNFSAENNVTNGGISMQADYEMGSLNLTSISAYRESRNKTNSDSDFSGADLIGQNRGDVDIVTKTQELRLTSDFDGPFNFLLGGFYMDENIKRDDELLLGRDTRNYLNALTGGQFLALEPLIRVVAGGLAFAGPFGGEGQGRAEKWDYDNETFSVFGTADLEITDGLIVTGGFNYTKDKKNVVSNIAVTDVFSAIDLVQAGGVLLAQGGVPAVLPAGAVGNTSILYPRITPCPNTDGPAQICNPLLAFAPIQFIPPFLNIPNAVENGRSSDDKLTYSLRVAWEASDNINLYASYGTGFKSTSWNLSIDSRPFAADFVPGSLAQGAPIAPSAIRTAGLATNNLTTGTRYADPEKATVMEMGLKAKWDSVAFNLTIFDQSIKDFQGNSFIGTGFVLTNAGKQSVKGLEFDGSFNPIDALELRAAVVYLDAKYDSYPASQYGDLSGKSVGGVPEWSTTLGATYTAPLNDDISLILNADYSYQSNVKISDDPAYSQYQREVNNLGASATLVAENGVQFSLWARNLTNEKYFYGIFPSVIQDGSVSGYPTQPRTFGASVKYKF